MNPSPLGQHNKARTVRSAVQLASRGPAWPVPIRGRSSDCVASVILSTYAPRGANCGQGARSNPLRSACIAEATSSQTIELENVQATNPRSFARRTQPLLEAQDDVRALQRRLKADCSENVSASQCSKAIKALCAARERWSDIRQAYSDFRAANIRLDLDSYRMLTAAALEAKQGYDVVELLKHEEQLYGPPPQPVYCSMISQLLKRPGRGTPCQQAAYKVWQMLRASGHKLDAAAYRTGMNLCVELGKLTEARRLMDAMRAAGHRPGWGSYHILMKYHARRGDMNSARRLFSQLRAYRGNRPLEISAYNTLLDGFVRLGDLTMARAVLDKARREGSSPDAFTYSSYASGLVAAGRLDEAEALLGEMAAEGLPPNPVVYGAVMDGCARLSDWSRVERLLKRMRADGLHPSVAHYNMLIRGRSYSYSSEFTAQQHQPVTVGGGSTIATAGGGHVEALMAEMRAAGLRPDAITYGTLIDAAVRSSSIEAALEVLSAMRVEGVQPDGATFTSLMKLFRTQGRHVQALEFFEQLSNSRSSMVDLWALCCLVKVHASVGEMAEAEDAQGRANELATEQGRPPPAEAAFALLQAYGQQGQLRPALLSLRRFLATGGRPHRKMCEFAYRLCLKHFDFRAASQVLRAMRLMRGLQLRETLYRQWWEDAQRRLQARRQAASSSSTGSSSSLSNNGNSNSGTGSGDGIGVTTTAEKWKWWFGLPNNYYGTDWR